MHKIWEDYRWIPATAVGSAVFALGFSLFLQPNEISPGGISGLALVAVELLGYGSGFLRAWWRRCVLGRGEFEAFTKNFYK